MPKIIDEARDNILRTTRRILLQQGYAGVSVRSIAAECGIAVGTIYNYFSNKETLIAHSILQDWVAALAEMDDAVAAAASPAQGVVGMYAAIVRFADVYRELFGQFARTGGSADVVGSRHVMLRTQLVQRIEGLRSRLCPTQPASLAVLLAETVLAAAMQQDISAGDVAALVQRVYPMEPTP